MITKRILFIGLVLLGSLSARADRLGRDYEALEKMMDEVLEASNSLEFLSIVKDARLGKALVREASKGNYTRLSDSFAIFRRKYGEALKKVEADLAPYVMSELTQTPVLEANAEGRNEVRLEWRDPLLGAIFYPENFFGVGQLQKRVPKDDVHNLIKLSIFNIFEMAKNNLMDDFIKRNRFLICRPALEAQ